MLQAKNDPTVLVPGIYAAAADNSQWKPCIENITSFFSASHVGVMGWDRRQESTFFWHTNSLDEVAQQDYENHFALISPYKDAGETREVCRTFSPEDIFDYHWYERTEFHSDFLSKYDFQHQMGCDLIRDRDATVSITITRPPSLGMFSSKEKQWLDILNQHLVSAYRLLLDLKFQELISSTLLDEIDHLGNGIVFVTQACEIVVANKAASSVFHHSDGLCATAKILTTVDGKSARELSKCIWNSGSDVQSAQALANTLIMVPRPSGKAPYIVRVTPINEMELPAFGRPMPSAVITIVDPSKSPKECKSQLRRVYGLTPAEADVAQHVLEGRTDRDIAKARGSAVTTVKTLRKRLYEKMEVHSRQEFFALCRRITS